MANKNRYKPTISVITVVFNGEPYLESCIKSIIGQTYESLEYLVVDGGSSDGSVEIIRKYETDIDFWISEPDDGIADAMNKGLAMASGDYIIFLHSDDYFIDSTVLECASRKMTGHDIYVFQVILEDGGSKKRSKNRSLDWRTNLKMGSCHQGQFCLKRLFEQIGPFDVSFKINMDYDFILRAYRVGATSLSVDIPVSVMRLIGVSSRSDWQGLEERFLEEHKIHMKNCTGQWMRLFYVVYWYVYIIYRRMFFILRGCRENVFKLFE